MRGGGELGSCRVSDNEKVVHRSPNKLWRSHFILLLFLLHGTEFRVVFSSTEGFGTEFRDFLFRGTTGIPSEITICSVYSVFRGINFLSEIPNPNHGPELSPSRIPVPDFARSASALAVSMLHKSQLLGLIFQNPFKKCTKHTIVHKYLQT